MKNIIRAILILGIVSCFLACGFTANADEDKSGIYVEAQKDGQTVRTEAGPGSTVTVTGKRGSANITKEAADSLASKECCRDVKNTADKVDPENTIGAVDDDADDDQPGPGGDDADDDKPPPPGDDDNKGDDDADDKGDDDDDKKSPIVDDDVPAPVDDKPGPDDADDADDVDDDEPEPWFPEPGDCS